MSLLLAVSAGADSVALLRAMHRLKTSGEGRLLVAHFNHRLRGRESDRDEAFVVELCRWLEIPCEVSSPDPGRLATGHGEGLEGAARRHRYAFFQQAAARLGARYVVTAHTADDQAETILHRIVRGTGIAGLAGMARARPLGPAATLIRPLLGIRRGELRAYLDDLGQPYRCDSSNRDTRLTRNRIRLEILPRLAEACNPAVVEALVRLGQLAGEVQGVVAGLVGGLLGHCVVAAADGPVRILLAPLASQPRHVVRELLIAVWQRQQWPLQAMGFAEWDLLAEMALAPPADSHTPLKRTLPGEILAERADGELHLLSRRACG
jgi:tRNA(Ile)-lysidine synthase